MIDAIQRTFDNPFCTARVRPGAMPFIFAEPDSPATLLARWEATGRRGAIVGPHGSGKSTLLATLWPHFEQCGWHIQRIDLHDGERRVAKRSWSTRWDSSTLLLVDGYEQLSRWARWRLRQRCRASSSGLLATAHADVGLPVVFRVRPDIQTTQRIVQQLLANVPVQVSPGDVQDAFRRHPGDIRETLFALYDLYEFRRARL